MRPSSLLAVSLSCALLPSAARADSDWFASLYTGDGIELRSDERVFTLFAILNALGYDQGPVVRKYPIPRHELHPVRREVRSKLSAADPEVRKQAEAFFDAHPEPIARYLGYALASSPPPFALGARAKELGSLKGFESLLRDAYAKWGLQELIGQSQSEYRKALRGYLSAIDGPMGRARKLLRVPEDGPTSVVVMNLLEGKDEATGVVGEHEVVVVVGPSDAPQVEAVVREYARVFLEPQVAKRAQTGWSGGPAALREAQAMGAREDNVGQYATSLFARALALNAMGALDSAYEAQAQQGYFGLKEIARGFEDSRPLDAWVVDALVRAESRRPAVKK